MFTGIVEEIGQIAAIRKGSASAVLSIQASKVLEGTKIGDSIAVNGICLTVTGMQERSFTADVMAETLRRSSLGVLGKGAAVNLERAMAADGRFGGHIVSGHIDGTGEENIPFFISPPYHVLMITCSRLVMLNTTAVSELRPSSL